MAQLNRLGLRRIVDLLGQPRAGLARRFGRGLVLRLDQAMGSAPEPVSPARSPDHFAVRLTLPEPIGLMADLVAGLERMLPKLCARLEARGKVCARAAAGGTPLRSGDGDADGLAWRAPAAIRRGFCRFWR